jgi:uncharacterized circularly permuted ATP-grasp superfamily protein
VLLTPEVPFDEARDLEGAPLEAALAHLEAQGPERVAAAVAAEAARRGLTGGAGLPRFVVDPVPRVVPAEEWELLAAALAQRLRALDAWVADAHGPREAVRAGVVPAGVLDSSRYLERDLVGVPTPAVRIGLGGPDLVRGPDGGFLVLEDNVRTPAMLAVAVALRRCLAAAYGPLAPDPQALEDDARALVLDALAAAVPPGAADPGAPCTVVLVDRAESAFPWELDAFGPLLGLPLVGLGDLAQRGGRVVLRAGGRPVDVVLRRTSEERLRTDAGAPTALGDLFIAPLRAGRVAVVNAFGTGVADDKRVFPHVPDLVRFLLGEEPLLAGIPCRDAGDPQVLAALEQLVAKPRSGSGGRGVLVGPQASAAELATTRAALRDDPGAWLVQECVRFSVHPTWVDGALAPRHVDLRPYVAVHGGRAHVLRGGLCRVARTRGDLVVNASRGGGGKDVWVQ